MVPVFVFFREPLQPTRSASPFRRKMRSPAYHRSMIVILAIGVLLPIAVWGAGRGLEAMFNAPVMWIPESNESRRQFSQFVSDFRSQDVILVSWEGCSVDDQRLDWFAEALSRADDGHAPANAEAFFHRVVSGRSSVKELQSSPLQLTRDQAMHRLSGSLIGPTGMSCAMVVLTTKGAVQRDAAIAMITRVLRTDLGLADEQVHLGGTPVIGQAIDDASVHSMVWLALPSSAVILLLCCVFLRSWRLILLVLGIGFFGEQLAISLVYFTGNNMNAVFVVMSPLVFVLSASTGIHLCNYYRDEVNQRGVDGAAGRMLSIAWKPCLLSTLTTVAGLLSLLVSEISAVRQFAAISAACISLTTILMLLTVPGILERWPLDKSSTPNARPWTERNLKSLALIVLRRRSAIVIAGVTIMAVATGGLARLRTTVEVFDLLDPDSPIVKDHKWLEDNVVPLTPLETIIRFEQDSPLTLIDRIRIVREIETAAVTLPPTRGVTSALTFLPSLSGSKSVRASIRRTLIKKRFQRDRARLVELGYLHETPSQQSWRVTSRIPAFRDLNHSQHLAELNARNQAVLDRVAADGKGVTVTVTGVVPVSHSAQQMLLEDLVGSFFAALLVIGVVIVIGLRSLRLGLVAMIPNVFPLCVLFGVMGWLGYSLDIGSMMTASVALGIAVDDTVHFLLSCRRHAGSETVPNAAVTLTIEHCGKAIAQTTIVCGLGMLVFGLSDFGPTSRFAWIMFLLLFTALIADLVFLPALLTGPFRKVLRR